ncbi:hypothetical protein AWJ19_03550 [Paenibacillus sp. DMB5]|nr:hypothetical protein AWJ19_03550 [Paenibacillus sp. DMB5]
MVLARPPTFGEMRGIFASHFIYPPAFGGFRGIFASHFIYPPTFGGIRGIFASHFVHPPFQHPEANNKKPPRQAASFFISYIRSYSEPAFFTGRSTA